MLHHGWRRRVAALVLAAIYRTCRPTRRPPVSAYGVLATEAGRVRRAAGRVPRPAGVRARGSEVKAHHMSGFCDEAEDLRRKIHVLTGIFTVSTKTARDRYEVISRRRSLPIFLLVNGPASALRASVSAPMELRRDKSAWLAMACHGVARKGVDGSIQMRQPLRQTRWWRVGACAKKEQPICVLRGWAALVLAAIYFRGTCRPTRRPRVRRAAGRVPKNPCAHQYFYGLH